MKIFNKHISNTLVVLLLSLLIISCNKEKENEEMPKGKYSTGLFIVNEGPFGSGTGTITFISESGELVQDVYALENGGAFLGNIAQSMIKYKDKYFISVNNANKIVIVNASDFKFITEITGIELPRYFASDGDRLFVSSWGADFNSGKIYELDGETNSIKASFETGGAPEEIHLTGRILYVPLASVLFSSREMRIHDINTPGFDLLDVHYLCDNPISIKSGPENHDYLLCRGNTDWNDPSNNSEGRIIRFLNGNFVGAFSVPNGSNSLTSDLHYIAQGAVWNFIGLDNGISIKRVEGFYHRIGTGLNYFDLVLCDAGDFQSQGKIEILESGSTNKKEYSAGVIPGFVYVSE
jgi:hypothetical protein